MLPNEIKLLVLLFLTPMALEDVRKKRLSSWWLMLHTGMSILVQGYRDALFGWLSGALVGGVLLLIAQISKEKLGFGDGWLFVVCGGYMGFFPILTLLMLALALCSIWNGGKVLLKRVSWKAQVHLFPMYGGHICYSCVSLQMEPYECGG